MTKFKHVLQVFKGTLWSGQYTVAVKELNNPDKATREELGKEMELLAGIRSPYVTQFIGVCFRPRLRMVMEFLEGGSLYDALRDDDNRTFSWYKRYAMAPLTFATLSLVRVSLMCMPSGT